MDDIEKHEEAMLCAFARVRMAEDSIAGIKSELARLKDDQGLHERELESAWQAMAQLMADTGEVEVILPDTSIDYKIAYSTPRETVKADPDATPDEFCKIERKPKLVEIGKHLNQLRDSGQPLPNWAQFEAGANKLTWKAIKKTKKEKAYAQ